MRRERGEGEGRREKEGEKPGQVFSSASLLFLGPAVNRQAEEGWASETLFFFSSFYSASYSHIQSVPSSS